jgi:hypothetical protein
MGTTERQQRRVAALNEVARQHGFDSWTRLETAVINQSVTLTVQEQKMNDSIRVEVSWDSLFGGLSEDELAAYDTAASFAGYRTELASAIRSAFPDASVEVIESSLDRSDVDTADPDDVRYVQELAARVHQDADWEFFNEQG